MLKGQEPNNFDYVDETVDLKISKGVTLIVNIHIGQTDKEFAKVMAK